MIELSNTTEQTLAPGQSIVFDDVILHTGCGECHRKNTSSVKMRANGNYDVFFAANIGSPTAATPVQLSVQVGGSTLPETTASNTPAAVTDRNNVARATTVKNCCGDYDRLTVTNTGANSVIVGANSVLRVRRVS